MRITIIGPMPLEEHERTFEEINECADRDGWVGRGCTASLPGGDGGEKGYGGNKIVGPEAFTPHSNTE